MKLCLECAHSVQSERYRLCSKVQPNESEPTHNGMPICINVRMDERCGPSAINFTDSGKLIDAGYLG